MGLGSGTTNSSGLGSGMGSGVGANYILGVDSGVDSSKVIWRKSQRSNVSPLWLCSTFYSHFRRISAAFRLSQPAGWLRFEQICVMEDMQSLGSWLGSWLIKRHLKNKSKIKQVSSVIMQYFLFPFQKNISYILLSTKKMWKRLSWRNCFIVQQLTMLIFFAIRILNNRRGDIIIFDLFCSVWVLKVPNTHYRHIFFLPGLQK